ncbi:MAG: dynamin family protein, partial [Waterburya sp.]
DTLIGTYQIEAAKALESNQFNDWQQSKFQLTILRYIQAIQDLANQSCNEFQKVQSAFIDVSLPSYPKAYLPQRQDRNAWQWTTDIFNGGANRQRLDKEHEKEKWDTYKKSIYDYLSEFSKNTLKSLNQYEQKVESLIVFPIPPESPTLVQERSDLVSLNSSIDTIIDIEKVKNEKPDIYQFKGLEKLKVRFLFCKNWLSCFFRY